MVPIWAREIIKDELQKKKNQNKPSSPRDQSKEAGPYDAQELGQ